MVGTACPCPMSSFSFPGTSLRLKEKIVLKCIISVLLKSPGHSRCLLVTRENNNLPVVSEWPGNHS